jgi:hypothetical protein
MLVALNLGPGTLTGLTRERAAKPSQRGIAQKKRATPPSEPTRSSRRARGEAAEHSGIEAEHADGTVVLTSGTMVAPSKMARTERKRDPADSVPFHRLNNTDDDDDDDEPETKKEADGSDSEEEDAPLTMRIGARRLPTPKPDRADLDLIDLIEAGHAAYTSAGSRTNGQQQSFAGEVDGARGFSSSRCRLDEELVVKATKSAIVHVQFQPRADVLLLAAADKEGHVSLWHADRPADHSTDGVALHRPHTQYVSGLGWGSHHRSPHALFSSSYDGTIKCLNAERREWSTLFAAVDEHEISAFSPSPDSTSLWYATNGGMIGAIDTRSSAVVEAATQRNARKINTLHFDASGREWLLAASQSVSGKENVAVKVWDVRKWAKKPIVAIELPKSSQSAVFAPDGSGRLLVTCFDDRLRIFDMGASAGSKNAATPTHVIKHCTQTGRWVVPFRAQWSAASDAVLVGSMNTRVHGADLYDAATGAHLTALSDELLTAIPSRNAAHPGGRAIAAGTGSGRLHVFTH